MLEISLNPDLELSADVNVIYKVSSPQNFFKLHIYSFVIGKSSLKY